MSFNINFFSGAIQRIFQKLPRRLPKPSLSAKFKLILGCAFSMTLPPLSLLIFMKVNVLAGIAVAALTSIMLIYYTFRIFLFASTMDHFVEISNIFVKHKYKVGNQDTGWGLIVDPNRGGKFVPLIINKQNQEIHYVDAQKIWTYDQEDVLRVMGLDFFIICSDFDRSLSPEYLIALDMLDSTQIKNQAQFLEEEATLSSKVKELKKVLDEYKKDTSISAKIQRYDSIIKSLDKLEDHIEENPIPKVEYKINDETGEKEPLPLELTKEQEVYLKLLKAKKELDSDPDLIAYWNTKDDYNYYQKSHNFIKENLNSVFNSTVTISKVKRYISNFNI